jgi:hypothetical protein
MMISVVRSLSALGNRSEASGKSSPLFRSFEAQGLPHERSECFGHSENYATKKIGKMGRFPIAAVDSPEVRQTPKASMEVSL